MKNQLNALLLTAALTGLVGGTSVAAHAATMPSSTTHSAKIMKAGLRYSGTNAADDKHSCKGKNDCKGQGGCSPATTAARARTAAKARAVAQRTAPRCRTRSSPSPNCDAAEKLKSGFLPRLLVAICFVIPENILKES